MPSVEELTQKVQRLRIEAAMASEYANTASKGPEGMYASAMRDLKKATDALEAAQKELENKQRVVGGKHSKGKKRVTKRKTVKSKKGGYYSFAGDLGHPGAANWKAGSEMGSYAISSRGGNTQFGNGRKRKGKKGGKTHKMRGGSRYGAVSASYQGTGARGIADVVGISDNKPGYAKEGDFNNHGAQPGSGFGSFITAGK